MSNVVKPQVRYLSLEEEQREIDVDTNTELQEAV